MNNNTIQIADTTMESSIDDDYLEDELLERRREARRRQRQRRSQRRQYRRAEPQHQQQARHIRRRHMAHQELQQRLYYQHSRTSAANGVFGETIEERLFEAYDGDTMSPKDHCEQEQINELEGVAALERLALIHDEVEQSPLVHALEASQEQAQRMQQTIADEWDQTQLNDIETMSVSPSFDSVLDPREQMRQIDQMERLQEAREQRQYNHDQEQLEHPENE